MQGCEELYGDENLDSEKRPHNLGLFSITANTGIKHITRKIIQNKNGKRHSTVRARGYRPKASDLHLFSKNCSKKWNRKGTKLLPMISS